MHRQQRQRKDQYQIIKCPNCGCNGTQNPFYDKRTGRTTLYIRHRKKDAPDRIRVRCYIGPVKTDNWDDPKTDEGYQIILIQLLETVNNLIAKWDTQKGPNVRSKVRQLSKAIAPYQRFAEIK